jgi:membrane protein
MVILMWFYYSAQIFLFGAEFTQMYSMRYGSRILPSDLAVAVETKTIEDDGQPKEEDKTELPPGDPRTVSQPEKQPDYKAG